MLSKRSRWWRASATALGCLSLALVAVAAQVSPPNAEVAENAPSNKHQEISVDPTVLDRYVGYYQFGSRPAVMTVIRKGAHLWTQLSGQQSLENYSTSQTEIYTPAADGEIRFVLDEQGNVTSFVLHQHGQSFTFPRIDAATAQQINASLVTRIQSGVATPGSEAALRRLIAGIVSGSPNYDEMSPELAQVTRQQLPQLQSGVAGLGAVQSIIFRGVGNQGWDLYEVKQEHGSTQWRIALGANGIITGALVTAGP